jgi:peptidoglycan/LPS O-acetylase OafA/YrhL
VRRKGIGQQAPDAPGQGRRLPWFTIAGVLGIAGCVYALVRLEPNMHEFGPDNPIGALVFLLVLPALVCSLLYGLVSERTWLAGFFGSRAMVTLGASSYCFYLIHVGGPNLIIEHWAYSIGFLIAYLIILCISVLLWAWVEEPLRRLVLSHHIFRRTQSRAGSSPLAC